MAFLGRESVELRMNLDDELWIFFSGKWESLVEAEGNERKIHFISKTNFSTNEIENEEKKTEFFFQRQMFQLHALFLLFSLVPFA